MNRNALIQNFHAGMAILFKQLAKEKLTDEELALIVDHLETAIQVIRAERKGSGP